MSSPPLLLGSTAVMAILLAGTHLFASRLTFLDVIPRSRSLSFAGGVSVAYVFVHLLPELGRAQESIRAGTTGRFAGYLDHHAFMLALLGLIVFYGIERAILVHRRRRDHRAAASSSGTFWLHLVSFCLYNFVIGYLLLHREESGWQSVWFFFIAMLMHFVVNDYGLRQHYGAVYRRVGRWLLALAVVVGWLAALLRPFDPLVLPILFALLSGGVIMNVLKEELPEERESRFGAFAAGAAVYAAVLLMM